MYLGTFSEFRIVLGSVVACFSMPMSAGVILEPTETPKVLFCFFVFVSYFLPLNFSFRFPKKALSRSSSTQLNTFLGTRPQNNASRSFSWAMCLLSVPAQSNLLGLMQSATWRCLEDLVLLSGLLRCFG